MHVEYLLHYPKEYVVKLGIIDGEPDDMGAPTVRYVVVDDPDFVARASALAQEIADAIPSLTAQKKAARIDAEALAQQRAEEATAAEAKRVADEAASIEAASLDQLKPESPSPAGALADVAH